MTIGIVETTKAITYIRLTNQPPDADEDQLFFVTAAGIGCITKN
jgi:hypothetical protein